MQRLTDLRFIIGLFFTIVGALLFTLSFITVDDGSYGVSLNHFSGAVMLVFGVFMLFIGRKG